ncbi:MAG: hypothetical protein NVS3B26_23810 [Mycobacteriales bacterium]
MLHATAFSLGQIAEQVHHQVVGFAVGVDRPADFGHPQLDLVVAQQGEHELELRPVAVRR